MRFATGDRVIYLSTDPRSKESRRELVVYKAGRKWGYAKPETSSYPDIKFDLETGYEDAGAYSSRHRVATADQLAAEDVRRATLEQLIALGMRPERHGHGYPTDVLARVVRILAGDAS